MTASAIDIDTKILGFDFEILLFCLRKNGNRSSTSMDAPLRLGHRNTLNTMNATLELKLAIGLIARNAEDNLFIAAGIIDGFGLKLHLQAVSFGVSEIHAI